MKILVLDNYDSFTYNLVHFVEAIGDHEVEVYLNDAIALAEVARFDRIILSPGPGIPSEAGLLLPLIKTFAGRIPMLGVCLGHQAIGEAFGAELVNLSQVFHGISTGCTLVEPQAEIFRGLPGRIEIGRYHSWIVKEDRIIDTFDITARDDNGFVMAMQHKILPLHSVQFHPESVLTPHGQTIIQNWLNMDLDNRLSR